jgi:hypothetical protein
MKKARVFDESGTRTVWIPLVEVKEDEQGRILFWSPLEDPDRPGTAPGFFNNQQGLTQGDILTLRYTDGTVERVVVAAPPQTDLGNKGRTQFQIKLLE